MSSAAGESSVGSKRRIENVEAPQGAAKVCKTNKKRKKKKRGKKERRADTPHMHAGYSEPDESFTENSVDDLVVEGIMYNGAIYLLDRRNNVVYAGERTEEGDLIRVGTWDDEKKTVVVDATDSGTAPRIYPFDVDANDHCETPFQAYEDVAPLLKLFVKKSVPSVKPEMAWEQFKIYDPYYCAGSVKRHLSELGFPNVYNKCENFYDSIAAKSCPDFDGIVTNPPYSKDNVERLFRYCMSEENQRKPFFLLLPNYFVKKPWFRRDVEPATHPFFLVPSKRYRYQTPKGGRASSAMRKDRKTAPFVTFWYCSFGKSFTAKQRNAALKEFEYWLSAERFQIEHSEADGSTEGKKSRSLKFFKSTRELPTTLLNFSHQQRGC